LHYFYLLFLENQVSIELPQAKCSDGRAGELNWVFTNGKYLQMDKDPTQDQFASRRRIG
jgi:hypothetical protein